MVSPRRRIDFALAMILTGIFIRCPLLAQTNLETNAGVHFNFSTPGAGNLALGGAFLALAFDASAAYTNPAGLTTIAAPETLVEARHWSYTHLFTDRGRLEGPPSDDPNDFDDHAGLLDGQAENEVTGLSFLSYVYPRRDWSFAFYRHELVNFQADFSTQGAYLTEAGGRSIYGVPGQIDGRLAALLNRMDVDITSYGTTAARRLGHGLSLGLTVSYFDFAIDSLAVRFRPDFDSPANFNSDLLVNSQTQQGKDSDWGFAAGFLWESPRKRWSLGGVYRQGPDFAFQARSEPGPPPAVPFPPADQAGIFHVPDVWGVGVAFRPSDALRLAFDYDRVRYSQLTQGFIDIFNLPSLTEDILVDPELDRFVIDDVGELHLGLEYAFLRYWPVLTLRAGGWYEPDHSLRFEGQNVAFGAVFRRRGDQMHYTAGVGLALQRLQLDVAVDHSERVSVISFSAGFRQ
jgi:long-chain fatty acid transport protein